VTGYTTTPPPGAGGPRPDVAVEGLHLAGWWIRAAAAAIDGLIVLIPAAVLLTLIIAAVDSALGVVVAVLLWIPCVTLVALVYAPVMMARTDGQTLGRMAVGTRVVRVDGVPLDIARATLREVVIKWGLFYTLGGILTAGLVPLVDILWPLWDEQRRALHDLLARTRTVRT
jgi:uncharacterized RDD family membrane protein YckC